MWSDLLDEQGRKRAGVFYKAAFYDRSAHLSMNSRFSINSYAGTTDEEIRQCQVEAEGGYVKVFGTYKRGDYDELERIEAEAKAWLTENYPDWKNRSAYWDLAVADIKV
jgi:predicted metal-dependent phosphotriesterase family hydrolase